MTRKHFNEIAATIKRVRDSYDEELEGAYIFVVDDIARALAGTLAQFNTGFDRRRFLTACGVSA